MHPIEKVQHLLAKYDISALIIDNPIELYYLTQEELSLGRLVVDKEGGTLFVDGRYFEKCSSNRDVTTILTSGYEQESAFGKWWKFGKQKVGFDAEYTPYALYESLQSLGSKLIAIKNPLKELREIKTEQEIIKLKKAADLGSRGFDYLVSQLKEGVSEKELSLRLELFWLGEGADGVGFSPIIAFGENSSQPHYRPSNERRLKKGDLVLFDIGVVLDSYYSDMTRVVCFKEMLPKYQKIYEIVYEAHIKAAAFAKSGVKIRNVDQVAREWIEQKGYKDHFPHSLGHGVGLQIHESPRLHNRPPDAERLLAAGMVITIEPGVYLPQEFGVRLEDTYVVTDRSCESITKRPLTNKLPII